MANDVEYIFKCLFVIFISFSVKYLLMLFAHFPIELLALLLLSFENSFHTLVFCRFWFANVSSQSAACLFILIKGVFAEQTLNFDEVQFMNCTFY